LTEIALMLPHVVACLNAMDRTAEILSFVTNWV